MTLGEIDIIAGRHLWGKVQAKSGLTRSMLAAFLSDGIPRPIAEALRDEAGIPLSAWAIILESSLLRHDTDERIIRAMDVNTSGQSAAVKRGAARATRKHLAQQKFYKAGKTITDIAVDLRETRARVSSWMADGDANRPIPERHVKTLLAKYGVPRSAWTRIAD